MSMSKQIKEVNKPDPHALVISKKTEGEETICQEQNERKLNFPPGL